MTAADFLGLCAIPVFAVAYLAIMAEERLHLRKSVPALVAAGLIWVLLGIALALRGDTHVVAEAAEHNVLEFAELFLFLLVAMTYVNTLEERGVFDALRIWLVSRGLSYRAVFWVTGALAFVMSPVADNLTTALVMGAVVMSVGASRPRFATLACINIVVAANAGGAFSPFGDITTLMVWQAGKIPFLDFLDLLLPSLVNWLVPAVLLSLFMVRGRPEAVPGERPQVKQGAYPVVGLFLGTIATTVALHATVHVPPAMGMMLGLGVLKLYAYMAGRNARHDVSELDQEIVRAELEPSARPATQQAPLDIFRQLERVEWDTLLFFYGVLLCVGGLSTLGYLARVSELMYAGGSHTGANVIVGVLSAVVDNVPVMFAVLTMDPAMSEGQWLLVTLTAGVGGSLLSVGSAAGVALMGLARGAYTFGSHLRWSWAVAAGYAASVATHLVINHSLF